MADTYNYTVEFSIKDTTTGTIIYPAGTLFTLSTTEQAMYHIIIWKNGVRVQALTSKTLGDNTAAMTQITGPLVTGIVIPPNATANIKGNGTWNATQQGNAAANWLCYVTASNTALVKPLNPMPGGLVQYQDVNYVWHSIDLKAGTVVPTVTFSVASSVAPKLPAGSTLLADIKLQTPSNVQDAAGNTQPFTVPTGTTFISPCVGATTSYWVSPLIIPIISPPTTIGGKSVWNGKYSYELRFYNKDGSAGASAIKYKTLALLDQAVLFYKSSASCPSNVVAPVSPGAGAGAGAGAGSGVAGPVTFNPPSNKATRTEPFVGGPVALGYIVQDDTTAATINTDTTGKYNTKWGFKFTYNPTTFNYGTQSSSTLDPTTFAKDPANLISGTTMVTLELYLNRIVDFSALKTAPVHQSFRVGERGVAPEDTTAMYGTQLSAVDIEGILTRGTEYDLEFLYRVVNGNPRSNLVLGKNAANGSADFGYITGVPFILHFNDNLEYYCAIQSLTVNHVMFTADMIPMMSVVSLQLMRYPGLNTAIEMATIALLKSANATPNQSTTTNGATPKK